MKKGPDEEEISYVTFKDGHIEKIAHFRVRKRHVLLVTENAVYVLAKGDDAPFNYEPYVKDTIYVLLFSTNDEGYPTLQFKQVNDIKSIRLANFGFAESK